MYFKGVKPDNQTIHGTDLSITGSRISLTCEISEVRSYVVDVEISFNNPEIWYKLSDLKKVFK
jgi:hypothetical protein